MAWLSAVLILPSLGQAAKYFGAAGVAVCSLAVPAALFLFRAHWLKRFLKSVSPRRAAFYFLATMLILGVLFALIYPVANSGIVGGGSDRDDNLNLAATRLLRGQYPYSEPGPLGNAISTLPGTILIALPFVLLGNSAYQNFFWLPVLFFFLSGLLKDRRRGLLIFWMIIFLCPEALREFLTGGSLLANAIFVAAAGVFLLRTAEDRGASAARRVLAPCLLGLALSSRVNFLLILPVLCRCLAAAAGWKRAGMFTAGVLAAFALVTLPFYLHDPSGFTPLTAPNVFAWDEAFFARQALVAPLLCAAFAAALALFPAGAPEQNFLRRAALAQAFPVALLAALSAAGGSPDLGERLGYGLNFLVFGVAAFAQDFFA